MSSKSNLETEYLELNSKNEWPALYQQIRAESTKNSSTCLESVKPQNKSLNRYRDVSPYDHSRIVLNKGPSDYINANLIKVDKANRQYILTQGPLANTVGHFWLMIWEQNTKAVIMLNKLIEKKQEKCYQYWPLKPGPDYTMRMANVGLTLEYLEQQDHSYYLVRVLKLTDVDSNESRSILQYHYITWPDFGVPSSPMAFLEFLQKVKGAGVLEEDVGPAVVHCSAGIGRSGTFCLVDSCLVLIEKYGINSVDVKEILLEMRKYRMGLIQTPEQLRFSYQAIIEGAKQQSQTPSSPDKQNNVSTPVIISNNTEINENISSDEETPPSPPPRSTSCQQPPARPLPNIPKSTSLNDVHYEDGDSSMEEVYNPPSGPLPVPPIGEEHSSEDELEEEKDALVEESPVPDLVEQTLKNNSLTSSELRQRHREERRKNTEEQVRDMKRRQQENEQWTQLKRSLFKPVLIGSLALGAGLIAYIILKD